MTSAQARTRFWHRQVCNYMGIAKSTLRHRTLAGVDGTRTATGNQLYTGEGARTVDENTTDFTVWAIWRQREPKTNPVDDLPMGRTEAVRFSGQMPLFDDNGVQVPLTDEDWLITPTTNQRFKMQNPQISPEEGFWIFEMELMR